MIRRDDQRRIAREHACTLLSPGIFACHERKSRGRTRSRARMCVRKTDTFLRQPVKVGRTDFRGAVGTQVTITDVVGVNEDNIGFGLFFLSFYHKWQEQNRRA